MRLNQKGLSHHLILPVIVVLAVGSIGAYILNRSGATGGCSSNTYSQGSSGACVAELQRLTNKCVAAKGAGAAISADGAFGPITKSAVIRCQQASGIGADGIVGPQTWRVLDSYASAAPASAPAAAPALSAEQTCAKSTFGQGTNGSCVTILQQKVNGCLAAAGNSTRIATDGAFGQMTKNAVIACQQANGIGADGIVGPQTWGVLMKYGSVSSTSNAGAPVAPSAPSAPAATGNSAKSAGASSSSSSVLATQQRINACLRSKGISLRIAEDGVWGPQSQAGQNACNQGLTTAAKTSSQQRAEATAEKKAIVAEKKQSFVQKYISQPAKTVLEKVTGPISAWIID
ncbi:peptidoglycan-binding protein [Candidatus Saccharibacteria bacterium]|nr:peptidoglycan-binding protein [Candidatus Saccharibacteria bacterium]